MSRVYSKRIITYLTGMLMLLVSQAGCTASSLPPYEANYTAKMRGIRINSEREFVETGENTYKLSWSAKALWMRIKEWSEFKIIDDKVIPISYHYTRKGLGSDRPVHVYFDWEKMQASGEKGKKKYSYPLEPGTVDKLSFQVQMQLDLIRNSSLQSMEYKVAAHSGLREYKFTLEGQESLKTNLGKFDTLVFRRDKKDSTIRLYMSPEQYYLPIKVEQTGEDANTVVLKSWKSDKPEVEFANEPLDQTPAADDFDAEEALEDGALSLRLN